MAGTVRERVQVYARLRSAHLERAHAAPPSTIFYGERRYDFDDALLAGLDVRRRGTLRTAAELVWAPDGSGRTIEVNEPLMRHGLARSAVLIAALVVRRRLLGRGGEVVSYAIENRDPYVSRPSSRSARARQAVDLRLTRFVASRLDRIAFGTPAARTLYESRLGRQTAGARSTLVPALSARCACVADDRHEGDLVLFLGALTERKGMPELMAAWPAVLARLPRTRLAIRGAGPLLAAVQTWAAATDGVDVATGIARADVHALLRRAAVLVLFSQPVASWREQVGLPLVEGLAHGCAVVTSTETGLAEWLQDHGHHVLPPGAPPADLAAAVVRALVEARPAASVLADLPETDGRTAADRWLIADSCDDAAGPLPA